MSQPPDSSKPPARFVRAPRPASAPALGSSGTQRLNKRMADLGMCSRREADSWIEKGWVKVNGALAPMGLQVTSADQIEVDPAARGQQANQVTILMNKPMGFVSGQAEDGHEPAVSLFTANNRWRDDNARFFFHPSQLRGLAPAGRLDIDSIGLLVLTQDGRIAKQLIGEDSLVEKEYVVKVAWTAQPALVALHQAFPPELLARLRHGLQLDGVALKPAQVSWQSEQHLRVVLREGRKRQIRRMCELVGLQVLALKRIRIGRVKLGELPEGQWRYLGAFEKF